MAGSEERRATEDAAGRQAMPAGLRRGLLAALGLLLAGALYLLAVRGEALIADLAGFVQRCFF
jgi:hypothetical protein